MGNEGNISLRYQRSTGKDQSLILGWADDLRQIIQAQAWKKDQLAQEFFQNQSFHGNQGVQGTAESMFFNS